MASSSPRVSRLPPSSPMGAKRRAEASRPAAPKPTVRRRAQALRDLERWSEGPMRVLSFAWLMLIIGQLPRPHLQILSTFGAVIWGIFIADFALRFTLAPGKGRFLKRNWLMALALIVPALRLLPFLAALGSLAPAGGGQVLMLLGAFNRTMNALRASLGRRQVAFVFVLTVVVMMVGAAGMLRLEPHVAKTGTAGFAGYWDALWWTAMLMTTIGSAYWLVTPAGRILAFIISLYAVGVFGYVTAVLSSFFVGEDANDKNGPVAGADDIAALASEIRALREEVAGMRPRRRPGPTKRKQA